MTSAYDQPTLVPTSVTKTNLADLSSAAVQRAEDSVAKFFDLTVPGKHDTSEVRIVYMVTPQAHGASPVATVLHGEVKPSQFVGSVDLHTARTAPGVRQALERVNQRYRDLLVDQAGLSARMVEILDEWLEVKAEAHALQRDLERARVALATPIAAPMSAVTVAGDPMAPLSAAELGGHLHIGDEAVRHRERAGELFSVLRPGRKRGREYPAFQAWPEMAEETSPAGAVLHQVLRELGAPKTDGAALYGFFAARNDLLGDLTPVEVLAGHLCTPRALDDELAQLLASPAERRVLAVVSAARAYAADLAA